MEKTNLEKIRFIGRKVIPGVLAVFLFAVIYTLVRGKLDESESSDKPAETTEERTSVFKELGGDSESIKPERIVPYVYNDRATTSLAEAKVQRKLIEDKLPIYVNAVETTQDITTEIKIFVLQGDPVGDEVHITIEGVDYYDSAMDTPNARAYAESFKAALDIIRSIGGDPRKIHFVLGTKAFIRETANMWVKEFGLL
ncbi:hypothetical protein JXA34_03630 [Patescibacteria group bacterium]|nr:hypothetical protein [Patescibacteria group bacterium]